MLEGQRNVLNGREAEQKMKRIDNVCTNFLMWIPIFYCLSKQYLQKWLILEKCWLIKKSKFQTRDDTERKNVLQDCT